MLLIVHLGLARQEIMLNKERYLQIHSRFYDLLDVESVWFKKLVSFDDYRISSTSAQGPSWMIFHMMANSHTNELLNAINHFCTRARRLKVWFEIFSEMEDEDEKYEVLIEMLEPVFRVTMDYPYAFRSSLIYVSSLLLRETARLLNFPFKDFVDEGINYKTVESFRTLAAAKGWASFDVFLQRLNEINSKEFVKQTQNYRVRWHHRVEPNLEMGLLPTVVRQKEVGRLSYEFGVENPVKLSKILPLLASEYESTVAAFKAFWNLLNDQRLKWQQMCPLSTIT